ncbi:hypothetical protein LSAT2_028756, partial [Lamellibrachia satsuma]
RFDPMEHEKMSSVCWKASEFREENEKDKSINEYRIGVYTGYSASIFWLSWVCFVFSIFGISSNYWTKDGSSIFELPDLAFIKAARAFYVLGVITAGLSFICAVVFIFVGGWRRFSLFMFKLSTYVTATFFLIANTVFGTGLKLATMPLFFIDKSIKPRPSYAYFCMVAAGVVATACGALVIKQRMQARKAGRPKLPRKIKPGEESQEGEDVPESDDVSGEALQSEDNIEIPVPEVEDENDCCEIFCC